MLLQKFIAALPPIGLKVAGGHCLAEVLLPQFTAHLQQANIPNEAQNSPFRAPVLYPKHFDVLV